ncbi:putative acid anhydride hydrolase [Martiniozyma asiatica (nom. inval.)]|nr:putative acid anhydride hydrolase [Martiniozyma asiatica]
MHNLRSASVTASIAASDIDSDNESEIFAGAASSVVPTAVSAFHHLRSPSLRSYSESQQGDEWLEEPEEISMSGFRFFNERDIQEAKGVSSLRTDIVDGNRVDYDTDWNVDYDYDDNRHRSRAPSLAVESVDDLDFVWKKRKASTRLLSEDSKSYDSTDNANPYSEFFRGDAERGLLSTEEEEARQDYEEYHGIWADKKKKRADLSFHDKYFCKFPAKNLSQRFYLAEEDLVIGIAGYQTSWISLFIYWILSILTIGIFPLMVKWMPRWKIGLMGKPVPLAKSEWVVIEDQYGSLEIKSVSRKWYNRHLSTFLQPKKTNADELDDQESNKFSASIRTGKYTIDDIDPIVPILIWFEYRYMKLFYDPLDDLYKLSNNWIDEKWCHYPDIKDGINEEIYNVRSLIFEKNMIEILVKPMFQLLIDEVLHPFYVFQIFSIILWLADDYYYYAFCIFLISILSIIESLVETKSNMERMCKMAKFECPIRAWRNGFWKEISSADLVPGDIYEVSDPSLLVFPCDSILLTGDCIVNEAMLTGESVPVSKIPINSELVMDLEKEFGAAKFSNKFSRTFLYSGTKIVRVRYGISENKENEPATALVIRTGFNTTKGALVRSMLFPKPVGFKFYEDSFKYIAVMTIIAFLGFIFSTINFLKMGMPVSLIILRALDLITIVVPPALPATLTIGTNFALNRLRKKKIFCIAPMRVNVGGKVDIMAFDKTGTLTEEGLDICGLHGIQQIENRNSLKFSDSYNNIELFLQNSKSLNVKNSFYSLFASMVTCHSLKIINDERVGDPLDENMFDFINWSMVEDPNEDPILEKFIKNNKLLTSTPILFKPNNNDINQCWIQLKEFEFVSQLRRMSVICQKVINGEDSYEIFVKGAPEVMIQLCKPETIPQDYEELLYHYTHGGYRVIACACKRIPTNKDNLNLTRGECESDLDFVGFIIFENKLKKLTTGTINELKMANIKTVMCTGDNILTAISVGKQCGMINSNEKVFVPNFVESGDGDSFYIEWSDVDEVNIKLDPITLTPQTYIPESEYCFAVTGEIFKFILQELPDTNVVNRMLEKGIIFARMSPDEKHELVNQLRKLSFTVGFCGDGANDCGALKGADVGISLSEAEASVAAPFTSRVFEISCVLDIIKEGRASLVTSFSCFQYMSLYSAIQFITVSLLYKEGTNLTDFQFLYIDLFLIIPIAIFMSWSGPSLKLSKGGPTVNLISIKILIPLLTNILILLFGQIIPWEIVKNGGYDWYIPPIPDTDDSQQPSTDNTVLFIISNFQYVFTSVILTKGEPYRESIWKNKAFIYVITAALLICFILISVGENNLLGLVSLNLKVKFELILMVVLQWGLIWALDKLWSFVWR